MSVGATRNSVTLQVREYVRMCTPGHFCFVLFCFSFFSTLWMVHPRPKLAFISYVHMYVCSQGSIHGQNGFRVNSGHSFRITATHIHT